MSWIIGIVSFLVGTAAGALLFRTFRSDEVKVKELEGRLQKLSEEHENYKGSVHSHFNNSAKLLNDMTESYRNVYQHMAMGAQTLCPDYISSQLSLSSEAKALLDKDTFGLNGSDAQNLHTTPVPPLDYAAKPGPDKKSSFAEDYGIERPGDY